MADENKIETVETTTPADIAPPKKRRGPKPKNVAVEAAAESPKADVAKAAPVRGRRKNAAKAAEGAASAATIGKTRTKNTAKRAEKAPAAPVLDDIADLLQLEQENARLRKTLAEKLRAENADLRKRLGLS